MRDQAFFRLQQLINPNLPIGGFTYSQGAEWAVEAGWIRSRADAFSWLMHLLEDSLATFDLPILLRLYRAVAEADIIRFGEMANLAKAGRETSELRKEDRDCAVAMIRVINKLPESPSWPLWQPGLADLERTLLAPFAMTGFYWKVPLDILLSGFLWSWLENRVASLIKLVPLGQTDGQALLFDISTRADRFLIRAKNIREEAIGSSAMAASIAASQHETQYCRLFRS